MRKRKVRRSEKVGRMWWKKSLTVGSLSKELKVWGKEQRYPITSTPAQNRGKAQSTKHSDGDKVSSVCLLMRKWNASEKKPAG